jgi:hypothetical protein
LATGLRAHAAGLLCVVAAVELLIGHAVWLRRAEFVDRFVRVQADPALVGQTVLAWVDWRAVVAALDADRLPCSGSERQLLRIAASLAEGVPVDLGGALTSFDRVNLGLVAAAVLAVGAHHEGAAELAEVTGR